jgi:hypothetical protein
MTHPLIDFLKTPMAAPETPRLRHMRRWWMALCWALALAVLLLPLLKALFGLWGAGPALILALAAPFHGARYFTVKNCADAAFSKGEDA